MDAIRLIPARLARRALPQRRLGRSIASALALSFGLLLRLEAGDARFLRGDVNQDGEVDISDPLTSFGYLYLGLDPPACLDAADADDSGEIDISDGIYLLTFLFSGTKPPRAPYPECGVDPTADSLTCAAYEGSRCPEPPPPPTPTVILVTGRLTDLDGSPVANATVRIAGSGVAEPPVSAHADADGHYTAQVPREYGANGPLLVSAEASGYTRNQAKVRLADGQHAYPAPMVLLPVQARVDDDDPTDGTDLSAFVGGVERARLSIPAGAIASAEPVTVEMTHIDSTTRELRAFPGGDFLAVVEPNEANGGSPVNMLESFALAEVRITEKRTGRTIHQLAAAATLELRLAESLRSKLQPGDRIPWWYYDESSGLWVQDGEGDVFEDAGGSLWARALASHFSWWNFDKPVTDHGCIKLSVKNSRTGAFMNTLNFFVEGVTYSSGTFDSGTYNGSSPHVYCLTVIRSQGARVERVRLGFADGAALTYLRKELDGSFSLTTDSSQAMEIDAPATNASCLRNLNTDQCTDLGTLEVPINFQPVVSLSSAGQYWTHTDPIALVVQAWDPDGDAIALTWSTPDGGSIGYDVGGAPQWTPDPSAAPGWYRIALTASDGARSASAQISVYVGDPAIPDCAVGYCPTAPQFPFIERPFQRGDVNGDGRLELTDAILIMSFLGARVQDLDDFQRIILGEPVSITCQPPGPPPACLDAADTDDNGCIDPKDAAYIISVLFQGGASPAPIGGGCEMDPTPDFLGCVKGSCD